MESRIFSRIFESPFNKTALLSIPIETMNRANRTILQPRNDNSGANIGLINRDITENLPNQIKDIIDVKVDAKSEL